jgi:hypothetical protein
VGARDQRAGSPSIAKAENEAKQYLKCDAAKKRERQKRQPIIGARGGRKKGDSGREERGEGEGRGRREMQPPVRTVH